MSNLYETFKDSLVGELTHVEQKELAKFASALTSARGTDQQDVLIKEAMGGMVDPEDFVKVAHLMAIVQGHEKTAKMSTPEKIMAGTAIATALAGITPLAIQAVGAIRGRKAHNAAIQHAMQQHPMLGEPANAMQTRQNFQVLRSFAPDVASSKPVAANALVRMHRMGPAAADINMVKELATTQKEISSRRGPDTGANLRGAAQGLGEVGSAYAKIQDGRAKALGDSTKQMLEASRDMDAQMQAAVAAKREQQYAKDVLKTYNVLGQATQPMDPGKRLRRAEDLAKPVRRLRDLKEAAGN